MRAIWISIFGLILLFGAAGAWWVYHQDRKIVTLTVAAGESGSDSFTLMKEIAEVLDRHSSFLRLDLRESKKSSEGISQINEGLLDLATIESNTPAYTNVKLVADLFSDYFMLIARNPDSAGSSNSHIGEVAKLQGKRVVIPESGRAENRSFWSVIDHYKLAPESLRTFALPRQKAMETFLSGGADAIFFVRSLRDPIMLAFVAEAARRKMSLNFIPITQAEAMQLKRPYLRPEKIVKGAFDGRQPIPETDVIVPSLQRLLVAGEHVDEDAINELVSVIFANRLDLLIRMPLSSSIRDPRSNGQAGLALHPGAARFYDRDQPSFLQENAEPMALLVTIFAMLISVTLALRRTLLARAKNTADVYNDQLLAIAVRARDNENPQELRDMRRELGNILEAVVHDLDTDKVTEDGFRSFSLLWGSVRETVNDRIQDLRLSDQANGQPDARPIASK